MRKSKRMIVCFLAPALFMFFMVFLYPVCRTVAMSFFHVESVSDPVSSWTFAGLENYMALFQTSIFLDAMKNMMKIWLCGGLVVMTVSMLFAAILTSGVAGKTFYKTVIYVPNIINAVAMSTMWINAVFNKRFGFLHSFFELFGSDLARTDYMSGSIKFWSLLAAFCFGSVGYYMLIFIGGIDRIPSDIYEAATIDGASKVRQFFRLTLPLMRGVIKTSLTFWTIGVVGFFVWSQMWSAPLQSELSTITPFVYMYNVTFGTQGDTQRNAALGATVGVLMAVTVLVVFFLINRMVKDDDVEL